MAQESHGAQVADTSVLLDQILEAMCESQVTQPFVQKWWEGCTNTFCYAKHGKLKPRAGLPNRPLKSPRRRRQRRRQELTEVDTKPVWQKVAALTRARALELVIVKAKVSKA